ncbi:unnamed protein product [Rhizophagus irregularis]|nr:unnamed protein product [Rhizophagus irregularis]
MTKENYEIQTKLDKIIRMITDSQIEQRIKDRYRHLEEDIENIKKKVATHYEEWTRNRDIKLELIEDEEWSALLVYYLPQVQVRRKNEAIKETHNAGIGGITYSPSYCLRVPLRTSILQPQGWRANVDLKPILNLNVALSYISKYASRSEPLSFLSSRICCQA